MTDQDFFQELASYLSATLNAEFVCIDSRSENGLTARTLAVFSDGQFEDNHEYTLADSPRGDVVGKAISHFPASARTGIPNDLEFQDLDPESYYQLMHRLTEAVTAKPRRWRFW